MDGDIWSGPREDKPAEPALRDKLFPERARTGRAKAGAGKQDRFPAKRSSGRGSRSVGGRILVSVRGEDLVECRFEVLDEEIVGELAVGERVGGDQEVVDRRA